MRILGVDPGTVGGLAIVNKPADDAATIIDAIYVPNAGSERKQRVDVMTIRDFIMLHKPSLAVIERAGVMSGQGISSGFKYGRAVGAIEATVMLCSIPLVFAEPSVWKRYFKLPGKDKEAARQKALFLFPDTHALLAKKKSHGLAEAMLIGLYGASR